MMKNQSSINEPGGLHSFSPASGTGHNFYYMSVKTFRCHLLTVSLVLVTRLYLNVYNSQIHARRKEIDALLKLCGHEHDSLKNVIKCVISKVIKYYYYIIRQCFTRR